MTLLRSLQKPEESLRRPSSIDDTLLDGEASNAVREVITEQDPVTLAETVSALASQLKQVLHGNEAGKWSDSPAISLRGVVESIEDLNSPVLGCQATTAIGDLVFHSSVTNSFALTAVDNNADEPVIGYVTDKPTIITAKIQYIGMVPTNLGKGKVFLGTDGKFTLAVPSTGYLQVLGSSFGDGRLLFKPTQQRVKRN